MIGDDPRAEILDSSFGTSGRGAFHAHGSHTETIGGVHGSEDADMSNDKTREIRVRRKPKVSWATFFAPGLVGPKEMRKANSMDIRLIFLNRRHLSTGDGDEQSPKKSPCEY